MRPAPSPLRPLAACLALALSAGCGPREAGGPSMLLITVDTLRADALGAYGAQPSATPAIDRLAAESTLFERAAAPMPLTRPSHFSLLTARYPREHGVVNNRIALPEDSLSVAEILLGRGWRTAAFVSVGLLGPGSGAEQGFEVHRAPRRQRPANEVVPEALEWLDSLDPDEPFFAWVHLFDPHAPYELLDPTLGQVQPEMLRELPSLNWEQFYEVAEAHDGDVPRAVLDHARALYAAEVAWVDRWLAVLLQGLALRRDPDDVVVVFTADHGECFENGIYFEHADCMLESALHIPLLVRYPRAFPPGRRVTAQVSSVDVAPTLLALAGIEAPEAFSGRPLQQAPADGARYVLVQHPFYQTRAVEGRLEQRKTIQSVAGDPTRAVRVDVEQVGIVGPSWKYLRAGDETELYRDGDEQRNLAGREAAAQADLEAELERLLEQHPLTLLAPGRLNDELRETLEALGYVE